MCRKKSLEIQSLLYSNLSLSLQDSVCICQFHSTSLRSRVLYACVTLLHECTRLLHSICMRGRGRVCTFHCHEIESVSDGNSEILCTSDVSYFSYNFAISYSDYQFYIALEFLSFSNLYFYRNYIL